jgi:hypothetical protein
MATSERKIEKARSGRVTAKDVRGDRQPKTAYRLKDGTPKALARLPDGVDVAVVPRSKAAETKLNEIFQDGGVTRYGYVLKAPGVVAKRIARTRIAKSVDQDAYALSPKAKALLRGRQIAEQDLRAAGGAYDLQQVTELLRISRQAVDKKVKDDALLAVPGPNGQRRYPAVQFGPDGLPAGLKEVLRALPSRSAWLRLNYLANPDPLLGGRRPVDVLHQGRVDEVVAAAKRVGEQGA